MELSSRNTCATEILETDDWLELEVDEMGAPKILRSKVETVGEVTLLEDGDGEKAAGLDGPPPLLLPPPPP